MFLQDAYLGTSTHPVRERGTGRRVEVGGRTQAGGRRQEGRAGSRPKADGWLCVACACALLVPLLSSSHQVRIYTRVWVVG